MLLLLVLYHSSALSSALSLSARDSAARPRNLNTVTNNNCCTDQVLMLYRRAYWQHARHTPYCISACSKGSTAHLYALHPSNLQTQTHMKSNKQRTTNKTKGFVLYLKKLSPHGKSWFRHGNPPKKKITDSSIPPNLWRSKEYRPCSVQGTHAVTQRD